LFFWPAVTSAVPLPQYPDPMIFHFRLVLLWSHSTTTTLRIKPKDKIDSSGLNSANKSTLLRAVKTNHKTDGSSIR
jgi:hypothetical protein